MEFKFNTLDKIGEGVKRAVMLVDFNVPLSREGLIEDDFRIRKVVPTIEFLLERGVNLVLISHIGKDGEGSLVPVFDYLKKLMPIVFARTLEEARALSFKEKLVLLENVRKFEGEMENDQNFAKTLASLGEIFINEGFSVSHRAQASVVGIPEFLPSFSGRVFEEEVRELSLAFSAPKPFVAIIGGAKAKTKEPLINALLEMADYVFVGGALANDFLKGRGYSVGLSKTAEGVLEKSFAENERVFVPESVLVNSLSRGKAEKKVEEILSDESIVDIGGDYASLVSDHVKKAEFILWNGPLGLCEEGFEKGTEIIGKAVAESKGHSILGGGDTISAIDRMGLLSKFSFVSTGGGAMLDFLADGRLPGIDALIKSAGKKY